MLSVTNDTDPSVYADGRSDHNTGIAPRTGGDPPRPALAEKNGGNCEDDDWGIVEASSCEELNRSGILIVSGEDEASPAKMASSETGHPITASSSSVMKSEVTYVVGNSSEHETDSRSDEEDLNSAPSIPTDIPSNLASLCVSSDFLAQVSVNTSTSRTTEHTSSDIPTKDISFRRLTRNKPNEKECLVQSSGTRTPSDELAVVEALFSSNKKAALNPRAVMTWSKPDKKECLGRWDGIRPLSDELAVVEALFSSNKKVALNPRAVLLVALGFLGFLSFLALGTVFALERQAWKASSIRLEERIERLQLELVEKLESEKKHNIQRQLEFADLKEEFKEAFQTGESKPAGKSSHRWSKTGANDLNFDSHSSLDGNEGGDIHFENCWIQAEAKLGECAREAKNAFRSKFRSLGRSLWNMQEQVVDRVNDISKRIHTAAKEAAESVVLEGEQKVSNDVNQTAHRSFRSITTTLVSSVAFASLAAVVADKAATFISQVGDDQD